MNALAVTALVSWLIAEVLAVRMLRSSPGTGSRAGIPRSAVAGHVLLTCCGLLSWTGFVLTASAWLAWAAIGCLAPAVVLSVVAGSGQRPQPTLGITTDEMLARALEDETLTTKLVDDLVATVLARPVPALPGTGRRIATLVPAALAVSTVLLAVLAAISAG